MIRFVIGFLDSWHKLHMPSGRCRRKVPDIGSGVRAMADDLVYRVCVIVAGLIPVGLIAAAVFMQ